MIMERFFNTEGPVRADDNYCLPPLGQFLRTLGCNPLEDFRPNPATLHGCHGKAQMRGRSSLDALSGQAACIDALRRTDRPQLLVGQLGPAFLPCEAVAVTTHSSISEGGAPRRPNFNRKERKEHKGF